MIEEKEKINGYVVRCSRCYSFVRIMVDEDKKVIFVSRCERCGRKKRF